MGVTSGEIEAKGGLRAVQPAAPVAAFPGASFEGVKHGSTDTTESCVRGNVIERDLAGVRDAAYGDNARALDRNEQHVADLIQDLKMFGVLSLSQRCRISGSFR